MTGIEPGSSDNTDIGRPVTWSRIHDRFIVSRNAKNLPRTEFFILVIYTLRHFTKDSDLL